jgi:hypothetical protein
LENKRKDEGKRQLKKSIAIRRYMDKRKKEQLRKEK